MDEAIKGSRLEFTTLKSRRWQDGDAVGECQAPIDICQSWLYTSSMILSYRHKGLAELADTDKSAKIRPDLWVRTVRRLDAIATAKTPEALRLPGFDFHPLKGMPQRYSVHVNGPWCLTFGWDGENAVDVDLENYH